MSISLELLRDELRSAIRVLGKWEERVDGALQLLEAPPSGLSGAGSQYDERELCAELLVVAGKCETIAAVLAESLT